jgi:hypothetical protein
MNPSDNAEATGVFTVPELNTSFYLDEGEYQIYIHPDQDPGNIKVIDPQGNVVFEGKATGFGYFNFSGDHFEEVGTFSAGTTGTYTANSQSTGTIYVTPPSGMVGINIVIVFVAFFIAVIIGFIIGRRGVKEALERGEAVFKLDE